MHNIEEIREVINEFDKGQSKKSLSKKYKISRATIKYWVDNRENFTSRIKKFNKFVSYDEILDDHNSIKEFIVENKAAYNYILGFYLGDGYIDQMPRTYRLRLAIDIFQKNVIEYCYKELKKLFPKNSINIIDNLKENLVNITVYSNKLKYLYPQSFESGKKHNRKIELSKLQIECIDYENLLKGLFHSDGSFYFRKYKSKDTVKIEPAYNFVNSSRDILDLFCLCLDKLNIVYSIRNKTEKHRYACLIQRKLDVENMFSIVGYKIGKNNFKNVDIDILNKFNIK